MKARIIFLAVAFLAVVACTDTSMPTAPDVGEARFDGGGITFGGGNVTGGEACDGERTGGITFGGGNNTNPEPCPEPVP